MFKPSLGKNSNIFFDVLGNQGLIIILKIILNFDLNYIRTLYVNNQFLIMVLDLKSNSKLIKNRNQNEGSFCKGFYKYHSSVKCYGYFSY